MSAIFRWKLLFRARQTCCRFRDVNPDFHAFCAAFLACFTFDLQPALLPPSLPHALHRADRTVARSDG